MENENDNELYDLDIELDFEDHGSIQQEGRTCSMCTLRQCQTRETDQRTPCGSCSRTCHAAFC